MKRRGFLPTRKQQDSPIDWLVGEFRKNLYLPDPGPLYALMGAVAANLLRGDPVWLMLVSPPSGGKTELLNSVLDMRGVFECASISNEAAFMSATAKKDKAKDATGGLLRQVGDHGAVIINDFTSILSLDQKDMKKVLGVLRECYQGRWTRHVGSEGGRQMHWEGKVAFLGGVTGAIDRYHEVSASLGERWVYYRMGEDDDSFERSRQTLMNASKPDWRADLKNAVNAFFAGLGLGFGEKLEDRRDLTKEEMWRIIRMATVGAKCRSAVIRDHFTKEIIGARETELETRIASVLGQFLVGMERVGVGEKERWRLLGKVVLDSMPRLRMMILTRVRADEYGPNATTLNQLAELIGCSRSTVDRTIEDLGVHGIVRKEKNDGLVSVHLTDWMRKEWQAGWHGR